MSQSRALKNETHSLQTTSQSPVSSDGTDVTLTGDAIIQIQQDKYTAPQPSPQFSNLPNEDFEMQSQGENKKQGVLSRIWGAFKSKPEPQGILEIRTRKLEETPNGFPRLAAFQSSEANFSLYRGFSYLHSRVLLDLQDEITTLERELDNVDLYDDNEEDRKYLCSRESDIRRENARNNPRSRRVILREIRERLQEYDKTLIKARTLESFQKPSNRNYRSVRRYHFNTKSLMDAELESIRTKEDIISLHSGREWASFDGAVESLLGQVDRALKKMLQAKSPPLQKFFRTPELEAKTSDAYISLYSSSRIDKLVNVFITFVIFILLIIPVLTLYHLTRTSAIIAQKPLVDGTDTTTAARTDDFNRQTLNAVGVLIVFTLLFSAAMSLLTRAARHELFAASAAYCAILVVFIGNLTSPGK